MKRQSAAEAALAKQVKLLYHRREQLQQDRESIRTHIQSVDDIILQLEAEITQLRQARESTSNDRRTR